MPEPRKHFTQAFRDEAVRLVQTSGRSRREVAADLGIGLSTLRNWINARRGRAMDEPPPDRQESVQRLGEWERGQYDRPGRCRLEYHGWRGCCG